MTIETRDITSLSDLKGNYDPNDRFYVNFSSQHLRAEDVREIANWVKGRHVEYLSLTQSGIDDEGAGMIAEAIKANRHLRSVDLTRNSVGNNGAYALAEAIKNNSRAHCHLTHNQIGPSGAAALVRAWAAHWDHYTVDLCHNNIGDEGARRIGLILKENSGGIRRLHLSYNDIGFEGDRDLAQSLPSHVDVCYRVEKVSGSIYLDRHPWIALALFILCMPIYLLMHCPCVRLDDEINGLIHPRK